MLHIAWHAIEWALGCVFFFKTRQIEGLSFFSQRSTSEKKPLTVYFYNSLICILYSFHHLFKNALECLARRALCYTRVGGFPLWVFLLFCMCVGLARVDREGKLKSYKTKMALALISLSLSPGIFPSGSQTQAHAELILAEFKFTKLGLSGCVITSTCLRTDWMT